MVYLNSATSGHCQRPTIFLSFSMLMIHLPSFISLLAFNNSWMLRVMATIVVLGSSVIPRKLISCNKLQSHPHRAQKCEHVHISVVIWQRRFSKIFDLPLQHLDGFLNMSFCIGISTVKPKSLYTREYVFQCCYMPVNPLLYYHHLETFDQFHMSCLPRNLRLNWWDKKPYVEFQKYLQSITIMTKLLDWQLHSVTHIPENQCALFGELELCKSAVSSQDKWYRELSWKSVVSSLKN